MPRIFTLSDLHVDFPANMDYMLSLPDIKYKSDVLIVAGDISDSMDHLRTILSSLTRKFHTVTFVPGNHELWVRRKSAADSIAKFHTIIDLCEELNVQTRPFAVGEADRRVWITPLFSWYRTDETDPDTLFIPKAGEDLENSPWTDNYLCRWPAQINTSRRVADYFLQINRQHIYQSYDAPLITFSHFLTRRELIFGNLDMARQYANGRETIPRYPQDPVPEFNFSRVAGCAQIDHQLRQIGAKVHIYGHQHRNRNRLIDGVHYLSKCLGYNRERSMLGKTVQPQLVWHDGIFLPPAEEL